MRPILQHVAVVGHFSAMFAFCSTSRMVVPRSRLMRTMISKMSLVSLRRQPQARLVEQDQRRAGHQRPRDRQHLLLPARQQAGRLARAFVAGSGSSEDALRGRARPRRDRGACRRPSAGCRAPTAAGTPRALRARGRCRAHDLCRDRGRDVARLELRCALVRIDDAGDGLQDRGLAGAVGAEHGHDRRPARPRRLTRRGSP